MPRTILIVGDSEAQAIEPWVARIKNADDLVRVEGVKGSRIELWGTRLKQVLDGARGTDIVVVMLGTNHYEDDILPSVDNLINACRSALLYWVLPAKIHGRRYDVNDKLAAAVKPYAPVLDSSMLDIEMKDGLHPTDKGARTWLKAIWAGLPEVETGDLSDKFFVDLAAACDRLAIDPVHLLYVCNYESNGVRSHIENPAGFVGLIQFGSERSPGDQDTLSKIGFTGGADGMLALSAEEQVPWVEKYLAPHAPKRLSTAMRVWQAVLVPATLDPSDDPDLVLSANGTRWNGKERSYYRSNAGLDTAKKGAITVSDLRNDLIRAAASNRFRMVLHRYVAITGRELPNFSFSPAAPLPVANSLAQELTAFASIVAAAASALSIWYLSREDARHTAGARRIAA